MQIVAAALFDARGQVLVAQRPPGKAQAGRWEFPGGKLQAGESQAQGLVRELREELGIELRAHRHAMTTEHTYADRHVTLHFYIAQDFLGVPRGLERQALRWIPLGELGELDILEADQPFVEALQRGAVAAT